MGIPALEQNYQYGQYGQYGQGSLGRLGGLTTFQPRIQPAEPSSEYGISIPQNHSYTTDEDGNPISQGLDGVGLAHRNPNEYNFHLIG